MDSQYLLEQIFSCMTELLEVKEFSKTVNTLTKLGRTLVNCERASFWFWDKDEKQYWTMAATGNVKLIVPEGTGIVGRTISEDHVIVCNNPYNEPVFNKAVDEHTGFITRSILCMPVEDSSKNVIGAFQVINKTDDTGTALPFDDSDIERLSLAVVYCEKTLESYLLQKESLKDEVTGLKNKSAFYEYYNTKVSQIICNMDTCILIGVVDNLNSICNRYGKEFSDTLFKKAARAIKSDVNIDDLIARWDDDKFIIILHHKTIDNAIKIAEKIQESFSMQRDGSVPGDVNLTMSFGVHTIDSLFTIDENIKFADDRLSDAIKLGGNRVV